MTAQHGGARPGAGRKSKHGPTVTVRVPVWAKDIVLELVEDIDRGHFVRAAEARKLLADHLEGLPRKSHPKRSVIEQALWLLGEGGDGVDLEQLRPRVNLQVSRAPSNPADEGGTP